MAEPTSVTGALRVKRMGMGIVVASLNVGEESLVGECEIAAAACLADVPHAVMATPRSEQLPS